MPSSNAIDDKSHKGGPHRAAKGSLPSLLEMTPRVQPKNLLSCSSNSTPPTSPICNPSGLRSEISGMGRCGTKECDELVCGVVRCGKRKRQSRSWLEDVVGPSSRWVLQHQAKISIDLCYVGGARSMTMRGDSLHRHLGVTDNRPRDSTKSLIG